MRGGGHDPGSQAHHRAHRLRHGRGAQRLSTIGMPGLVTTHLFDNCPRIKVGHRQALEMVRKMTLDLPLGLDHEAERVAIAEATCYRAECQCAAIPDRIEQ